VIVECLTTRPCTTGELVERFSPALVRTAVMKHLNVLEEAGLIRIEREGRVRWNHLEPK
jgi:DNA-binding transcriptional ArsR family regulator